LRGRDLISAFAMVPTNERLGRFNDVLLAAACRVGRVPNPRMQQHHLLPGGAISRKREK
jgi:hypothetical protein